MSTARRAVGPLQVVLLVLFVASVLAQVLLAVGLSRLSTEGGPELVQFRSTVLAVAVLGLLCAEVVIVATWRLLALVKDGRIFSASALPWVDVIVWAFAAVWVVLLGATVPVFRFAQVDDAPGLGGLHLLLLLVVAVPGLLMVVMRALLRQATTLRTDLDAVI
jgi:uncharacterized membrane protein